eukprot:TRINITY_DN4197_c0_g1_i14.p4 TRINITY_DN4197_c0_g1~~TRINITY_DN4197_c0_g1_i14.p4  ORF type:complete len:138 (-),score=9.65 TRINITY_DN4197_c0_g1_i14:1295-1708(-)
MYLNMIQILSILDEQWPDFGCEGIKVQRAHQPTSQCQGKKKIRALFGTFKRIKLIVKFSPRFLVFFYQYLKHGQKNINIFFQIHNKQRSLLFVEDVPWCLNCFQNYNTVDSCQFKFLVNSDFFSRISGPGFGFVLKI